MTTVLIEYEEVQSLLDILTCYGEYGTTDCYLDPSFNHTAFSDEILDLLQGGMEHPCNDIYTHAHAIRMELKRLGISVEYAEGIAVVPAFNLLVIFYDQPEALSEHRFQSWSELLVRSLSGPDPWHGLQERQAFGDPGLRFSEPDNPYEADARQRVPVPTHWNSQQPRAVQLPQDSYGIWPGNSRRYSVDQGQHRKGSKLQKSVD